MRIYDTSIGEVDVNEKAAKIIDRLIETYGNGVNEEIVNFLIDYEVLKYTVNLLSADEREAALFVAVQKIPTIEIAQREIGAAVMKWR